MRKMKNLKKVAVCGLMGLLFAFAGGAAACGGDNKEGEAPSTNLTVTFADQTVAAAYNSDFSIAPYLTAVDSNEMPYLAKATVKDSKGNEVALFENRFTVTDIDGYTVEAIVTIEGKEYKKTIKVEVQDRSMPVINMAGMKGGEVDKPYVIPQIEVEKLFDPVEIDPVVKVYYIGGNKEVEVPIENGVFTPTQKGEHRIEVTATDQYGTTKRLEEEFVVRNKMASNMLEDFNDGDYSILNAEPQTKNYNQAVEWLSTFQGATGVLKTKTQDGFTPRYAQSKLALKTGRTRDELAAMDFDYINVRAYIAKDGSFTIGSHNCKFTEVNGNEWVDIQITKDTIMANAQWKESLYVNKNADDPYAEFCKVHASTGTGDYLFYVSTFPYGENGAESEEFKGYNSTAWTNFINANPDKYEEMKEQAKGVEIYIDSISYAKFGLDEHADPVQGQEFTIPALKMTGFNGEMDITEYTSVSVTRAGAPVSVTAGKFTPTLSGVYTVRYEVAMENVTYAYEKQYVLPRIIPEGFLEDFGEDGSEAMAFTSTEGGGSKTYNGEWLTSYTAGGVTKNGILKIDITTGAGGNPCVGLKLNQTVAELKAMNVASIKITLSAKNANNSAWVSLLSSASSGDASNSHGHSSKYAGWGEIEIPLEKLQAFARFSDGNGGMDWSKLSVEGEGTWLLRTGLATTTTLYIDSIAYVKAQ